MWMREDVVHTQVLWNYRFPSVLGEGYNAKNVALSHLRNPIYAVSMESLLRHPK